MQKIKTKFITFICNMLICVLSLAAIGSYFIFPLWKVEASYHIQAATLEQMLGDILEEQAEENSEIANIDVKELVPSEGLTISFNLSLETKDVLSTLQEDAPAMAQNILDNTINATLNQFSDLMNDVAKKLTKALTKTLIHTTLKEQVSSVFEEEMENIEEIMSNAGIDDSYIIEKADELVDTIFNDSVTVNDVSQNVTNIVEEVFDKLANSGNEDFKDLSLSTEDKTMIEETVSDVLSFIAQEDGTIDIDSLIAEGLLAILGGESPEDILNQLPDEIPDDFPIGARDNFKQSNISYLSDSLDDSMDNPIDDSMTGDENNITEEEKDAQEELMALLREKIMEMLPENTAEKMATVLQIASYVLLFTFLTWAYLIVKIILKLLATNNSIRLGLPLKWGWLPFLVLYIFPTALFALIKSPPAFLANALGEEAVQSLTTFSKDLTITFASSAWVSFAIAAMLWLFNLFFYRRLRKTLKAIARGEISMVEEPKQPKAKTVSQPIEKEESETDSSTEDTERSNTEEETTEYEDNAEETPEEPEEETEEAEEVAPTESTDEDTEETTEKPFTETMPEDAEEDSAESDNAE